MGTTPREEVVVRPERWGPSADGTRSPRRLFRRRYLNLTPYAFEVKNGARPGAAPMNWNQIGRIRRTGSLGTGTRSFELFVIPEPSGLILASLGLSAVAIYRNRRASMNSGLSKASRTASMKSSKPYVINPNTA